MVFSVWTDFATGGGGGAGALAVLEVLSSAFRNVFMRRKRTTTDFFINPPFASGRARTGRNYSNLARLLVSETLLVRNQTLETRRKRVKGGMERDFQILRSLSSSLWLKVFVSLWTKSGAEC